MNKKNSVHTPNLQNYLTTCQIENPDDPNAVRLCVVRNEMSQQFDFEKKYPKSVTFFGSARLQRRHPSYQAAKRIAYRAAKELGASVVSGGGPGIMQAANEGASEAGGKSIGLTIILTHEQGTNEYVTDEYLFNYFFTRKFALINSADAVLGFPGGFGTLDEIFELLTLIQTEKIPRIPVILVGSEFWSPLNSFVTNILERDFETISPEDDELYTIVDNEDEIIEKLKKALEKSTPECATKTQ